jgi:endonuclease/exonuclease/phosphatase (EEP) superfamily protein YafD
MVLWGLGDRWWAATVLLFGPRWVLSLPLLCLIPAALVWDRALLPVLAVAGLVVVGPVMGLHSGWRALWVRPDPQKDIRIVTFNARGGEGVLPGLLGLIEDRRADVAAIQECGRSLAEGLRQLPGWHADTRTTLCLLSRFEIAAVREMDRSALELAGGSGVAVTYSLDPAVAPFFLTVVHLDTPRAGLALVRSGRVTEGISRTGETSVLRRAELRQARAWVDTFRGPRIVVGDFNTPPESRSYRESWGGWQNAFSEMGRGFGGTRMNGWIQARIDHILADDSWTVVRAELGEDLGSDHRPVVAELRLR